jgi:hypothetical protein
VARSGPPAYAWDWFARQRLLWREVRVRLAAAADPVALRYAGLDARSEVLPLLRTDYPRDEFVRATVHAVVAELAFGNRTDASFAALGFRNAPRGLRWWWTALTGEDVEHTTAVTPPSDGGSQTRFSLDEVNEGYGG